MHEVSLGNTLRDYLTGEVIEETTYEEFRQALARLLVEEFGYPKDQIRSKVELAYEVDGKKLARALDLVVFGPDDRPLLVVIFCAGKVGSFERETGVAARLIEGGPAPFGLATDTREASLVASRSGDVLRTGMQAIPLYDELLDMAGDVDTTPLTGEQRAKLIRIFHAYSGFLMDACCGTECKGPFQSKDEG